MKNIRLPNPKRTVDAEYYSSLPNQQKLPQYSANTVTKEKRALSEDEAEKLYETTNPSDK